MAKFNNVLFLAIGIWLLGFMWVYYYTKSLWLSVAVSASVATIFTVIMYKIPHNTKKKVKKETQKEQKSFACWLTVNDPTQLLQSLFDKQNKQYRMKKKDFVIDDGDKTFVKVKFKTKNADKQDVADAIIQAKTNKCARLEYYSVAFNADVKELLPVAQIAVVFRTATDLYYELKQVRVVLPSIAPEKSKPLKYFAFSEKRFKYYMISAFTLTLLSAVSFYPVYTLSIATICLALALYAKYNKKYNISESNQ